MSSTSESNNTWASSFLLDGMRGRFLHRSDRDVVVVDAHCHLVTFESLDAAEAYAISVGLAYQGEAANYDPGYDFDAIASWCRSPSALHIDCNAFIDVWNLLNDICRTVSWLAEPFRRSSYNVIYDKLFWGLNLSVFTPEGRGWTPTWSNSQVRALLRRVLVRTIFEFRRLLPRDF